MAWLPVYADESDCRELLAHLNQSDEIAFIVSAGAGKWLATPHLEGLQPGRYCLWHVPSGPLPLFRGASKPPGVIADPFSGWCEAQAGADPALPYFGAGHPGIIWLNISAVDVNPLSGLATIGLSSFEWIGNHYKALGSAAHPATEKFWQALRRWIKKHAIKVPRGGLNQGTPPEIWALQGAASRFRDGAKGGNS